jgi:hypothetical protein
MSAMKSDTVTVLLMGIIVLGCSSVVAAAEVLSARRSMIVQKANISSIGEIGMVVPMSRSVQAM